MSPSTVSSSCVLLQGKAPSKGSTPPYYGTITPDPNFSASRDAAALQRAIEAKGVDESAITEILARRTNAQRQQIKAAYENDTGKDLVKTLKSVLKSHYEDTVVALLMNPAQYDAYELRQAMKGLGTNEKVLNEILGTRSNHEIRLLKTAFKEAYGAELEHNIKGDTSGHYETALLALSKALYEAGEKKIGTVYSVFIDILTSRSEAQLCKIFKQYDKLGTQGFPKALEHEMKGDVEDCLMTLGKCLCCNSNMVLFECDALTLQGAWANCNTLTRILVSRSEVDLKKILQEYKRMYGKTLQEDINVETKGDYVKILLALCGDH
uniref:Annexin n=1 Tax=Electrophorus electricus TaxID=8005 RepID=A0A4W4G278_ELEEL